MNPAIEIRTKDPDLGGTIALWLADVLDEFVHVNPAGKIVIDDDGLVGRPVRAGYVNPAPDFQARRDGDSVRLICSSSAIVLRSRPWVAMVRKGLVRAGITNDPVPLDHRQVVRHQQRIRRLARRALGLMGGSQPCRFLLRVDDFPSPLASVDAFRRFHAIASANGVPYLLAVTPFLAAAGEESGSLSPEAIDILKTATAEGGEVALHGFSHESRYRNCASELLGLPAAAVRAQLDRAGEYLSRHDLQALGFVAPHNAYDPLTFGVLAERFSLICGGPESVPMLGYRAGPSLLMQSLYVPSYRGAYDIDLGGLPRLDRLINDASGLTIPVTLHWGNDAHSGFRAFQGLCERLRGRTDRWSDYVRRVRPTAR